MEKRKLQRIVGIVVVVAFVIVLIPLLIGKKEAPPQQVATLTASSSPEQQSSPVASQDAVAPDDADHATASAVSTADTHSSSTQDTAATTPANTVNPDTQDDDNGITPITSTESTAPQGTAPATAAPANSAEANTTLAPSATQAAVAPTDAAGPANNVKQQPVAPGSNGNVKQTGNTVPVSTESKPVPSTAEAAPAVTDTSTNALSSQAKVEKTAAVNTPAVKETQPAPVHKNITAKKANHFSAKELANLKKPAWVVQMGSFKNKSNAHRLTDQLRAAGFKAFTHEVTSSAGITRTRVYVGPEFKEASALKLSTQVEQAIRVRGFVVPYKPLAL